MKMRIHLAPDPILRQKCLPVEPGELKEISSKARQMAKLMYKSNGCGIAAPQVGIAKRLMIVDVSEAEEGEEPPKNPEFFINPELLETWGEEELSDEGCLSIPGITVPIKRHFGIRVRAQNLQGESYEVEAEGFYARAIQHEMDHLDGKTMFEHIEPISRARVFKDYQEALRQGAKPGDISFGSSSGAGASGGAGGAGAVDGASASGAAGATDGAGAGAGAGAADGAGGTSADATAGIQENNITQATNR